MSRKSPENKHDQTADEHQRNLVQLIKKFSYGHHLHTVLADFVELCATGISNAVDQQQFQAREKRYMEIVGKYSRDEVGLFPQMLAELTLSLERRVANMREAARHSGSTAGLPDVLGETYMLLELGNARAGQFFTPYHVSKLIVTMMIGDGGSTFREDGFMRLQEPACGAGGMGIAAAESLHDAGLSFQQAIPTQRVSTSTGAVFNGLRAALMLTFRMFNWSNANIALSDRRKPQSARFHLATCGSWSERGSRGWTSKMRLAYVSPSGLQRPRTACQHSDKIGLSAGMLHTSFY
jgi:type I restriction-modification system DNA methylase subunit